MASQTWHVLGSGWYFKGFGLLELRVLVAESLKAVRNTGRVQRFFGICVGAYGLSKRDLLVGDVIFRGRFSKLR